MKKLIFGLILFLLIDGFLTDELNVHVSSKNTNYVVGFIRRLFPSKNVDTTVEKNIDIKFDIGANGNEETDSVEDHHHSKHCHICVSIVRLYEKILDRSKSSRDVQKVFLGTCDVLRQHRRDQCRRFYQGKGLKVIKELLNGVNPKKICHDLHICRRQVEEPEFGDTLEDIHSLMTNTTRKSHRCKVCLKVTRHLERVLDSSKSLDFVLGRMSSVCTVYQTKYKVGCLKYFKKDIVVRYFKEVLAHENVHKICEHRGGCHKRADGEELKKEGEIENRSEKSTTADHRPHHHSCACKACVAIVKMYETFIDKTKTPSAVQKVFIGTCDILKPKIRVQCIKFYKGIGFQVLKDILKGVEPKKICKNLHLCRQRLDFSGIEEILKGLNLVQGHVFEKGKGCKICQMYTHYLEKVINPNKTLNFVIKKLSTICTIYSSKYLSGCKDFFKNPKVLQYYRSVLVNKCPFLICKDAGYCKNKEDNMHLNDAKKKSALTEEMAPCKLCRQVAYIYGRLALSKSTVDSVISTPGKVCSFFSDQYMKQCLQFVDDHQKEILLKFSTGEKSEHLCSQMGICSIEEEVPESSGKAIHTLCTVVTSAVYELVGDRKTEDNIREALHSVCDKIPEFFRKDCVNLLKMKNKDIRKDIQGGVSSTIICDRLIGDKVDGKTTEELSKVEISCLLCREVMKELGHLINSQSTKEEIESALDKVCDKIHFIKKDQCRELMHRFAEEIVKYLTSGVPLEKICETIGICHKQDLKTTDFQNFLPKFNIL